MVKTRTRILGIAPYEGMKTVMERAAQAYPDVELDIYIGDLEEGVSIVKSMAPNTYDCIISRGGTAALIRQITDLPVVEIRLSVYDVLSAMKLAENYSKRYAIVGFPSITEPAHTLCDLLGYTLDIVTIHTREEVPEVLERLKEEGYRMVVCDMVAHTAARKMGLDAFLITSGIEGMCAAIDQAISISLWFGRLWQENMFLRNVTQGQNGRVVVMETNGTLFYSNLSEPPSELLQALKARLSEVPLGGTLKFYYTERDLLYQFTAQTLMMDNQRYCLFYGIPSRIPLHSHWRKGVRSMNKGECEYLFMNSFYSLSGAMGNMAGEIQMLASVRKPVMIIGETGTGKEQIARYLYLHSSLSSNPFVVINCELMNEKSWDSLFNHENSPLNAINTTIYFQNFELTPETRIPELIDAIRETGLARRVRLIFSCVMRDGEPIPDRVRSFVNRLGCQVLHLPALRSRSDEIPSLASLYLSSLKLELGKPISGFEPRGMEMLCQYDWPNNYTQFKHVLQSLAALTDSTYIHSSTVAEVLSKERLLQRRTVTPAASANTDCTLEEITREIIQRTVAAHNGNRAAAARQLGISRTTLWRYMNENKDEK